jgi:hypothetical protein
VGEIVIQRGDRGSMYAWISSLLPELATIANDSCATGVIRSLLGP